MGNFERELEETKRRAQEEFYRTTVEPTQRKEWEQKAAQLGLEEAKSQLRRKREQEIDAILTPSLKSTVDGLLRTLGNSTWGRFSFGFTFEKNLRVVGESIEKMHFEPSFIGGIEVLASWQIGRTHVRNPAGEHPRWLAKTLKSVESQGYYYPFLIFKSDIGGIASEEYDLELRRNDSYAYFMSDHYNPTTSYQLRYKAHSR